VEEGRFRIVEERRFSAASGPLSPEARARRVAKAVQDAEELAEKKLR